MTDLLQALLNIRSYGKNDLRNIEIVTKDGQPRINKQGDPLETFIKDAFCNSFNVKDATKKKTIYDKTFSYIGSQNNPPDIMIRNGDAIEVKKISTIDPSTIALNSSYPKSKLLASSPMITQACKNCEDWQEKDIIYTIGSVMLGQLRMLTFVYGDCYAADESFYEDIKTPIMEGIKKLNLKLAKTKELAKMNGIDPLERSHLRVRGMWAIQSPTKAFRDVVRFNKEKKLCVFAIMREEKYNSFAESEKKQISKNMEVRSIQIPNPNNLKEKIKAKLISFNF